MATTDAAKTTRECGDGRCGLGEDVILDVQDGIARLLDLGRGRFYGLDPVGTSLLTLVLDRGFDGAVRRASGIYGVDQARIRDDLIALVRDLKRKGLLAGRRGSDRPLRAGGKTQRRRRLRRISPPGRLAVGALMILAWASIRLFGWAATVRMWERWRRTDEGPTPPGGWDEVIGAVDRLVRDAASRQVVLPMVCKERALAGYQILRAAYGLPATLVVGIQRHPFQAHAWVECRGRVVTDDTEHCATYMPVARYH